MKQFLLCLPMMMILAHHSAVGDTLVWPQFRGPGGSGIADDEQPPVEIGPDKNVKWKVEAPSGLSSPIVVGELLVLTAFEDGKLYTIAYRRADGSEAWRAEAPAETLEPFHPTEGSPAASTPATDGERIVSYFGSCGLFCYDLAGNELWTYKLPPVATVADFGTGVSPIIADGAVVLLRDESNDPKILAVALDSGDPLWEQPRESKSGFGTPAVWDGADGAQVVTTGFGQMIGYDLATGEERWFVSGMPSACCTTPVVADDLLYFAGWSPGDPQDTDFKMPAFDELLGGGADADGDGQLSKAESQNTMFKDFFDNNDPNKDGVIVREEWD
jgi:outer membrane protein assembly factor BamB